VITPVGNAVCGVGTYCDYPPFYWVDAGQERQFTFTYTLTNGLYSSATVTFNVYGPLAPGFTAQVGSAVGAINKDTHLPGLYLLGLPFQGRQAGIIFTANALPALGDQGAYSWVQIVISDQVWIIKAAGQEECTAPTAYPALDTTYPYSNVFSVSRPNDTATDSPASPLRDSWGESQRSFSAVMYLMWDPVLPASIPAPLASMPWQFTGDAINTLVTTGNGTTWTVPCGPGTAGQCAEVAAGAPPGQSFPTWPQPNVVTSTWQCP
jgi:hypothetical protein